ncbi:biotin transport system permease protein [Sanguibacter gelidistatuariae]|uniref:Biotin transport system permease protein n=1 Tax=Sanguibacter gelidistatuariae TaxID=1814289 RepID=A0A1G6TQQ4_9MICO|nr:energy-coupling factor transporter transmembrane protein EcfT [Sanguibacter gelidistatuariae]SDD31369.1 biotin transport system permease protein [Sanguibacter gelidistatuariae]
MSAGPGPVGETGSQPPGRRRRAVRPRWTGPLGLYSPGHSWVHRLGPGWKLAVLAVVSILLTVFQRPAVAVAALAGALAVLGVARVPLRATGRSLLPVVVVALTFGAYQWWARDWQSALVTSASLLAVVVLATGITATTRTDRLLDSMTRSAGPLRFVGIRPQTFALTVALVLRTVPALIDLAWDVRDAARARGLDRSPRALLVPFVLRAVARAHTTADALTARGLLDDDGVDGP